MHFATRTEFGSEADPLTEAAAARRRAGLPVLDLTESNPTRCGLGLPADVLLPPLTDSTNQRYRAEPFGPEGAREAVAAQYYRERGVDISAEQVLLTASTSEAYSHLFRLFCEAGDQVLVPQPSYPLFDLLARLCDVETVPYPLRFHEQWETDLGALEQRITPRTRAIVVVHPNNPTGHFARAEERRALDELAARHGLPLVVDEVFLDYAMEGSAAGCAASQSFASGPQPKALTFVMSGLSKVLALPQMKLGWTVVLGPEPLRGEAMARLEYIADTFLSVAAPAANAAATWLGHRSSLQETVRERTRTNLDTLDRELTAYPLNSRLPLEGGWSVLVRVPAVELDSTFALRLLQREGVLVHPGSFFGLPGRGWIVLSLLLRPEEFERGVQTVLRAATLAAETVHE